jgi:hypothetical protein
MHRTSYFSYNPFPCQHTESSGHLSKDCAVRVDSRDDKIMTVNLAYADFEITEGKLTIHNPFCVWWLLTQPARCGRRARVPGEQMSAAGRGLSATWPGDERHLRAAGKEQRPTVKARPTTRTLSVGQIWQRRALVNDSLEPLAPSSYLSWRASQRPPLPEAQRPLRNHHEGTHD